MIVGLCRLLGGGLPAALTVPFDVAVELLDAAAAAAGEGLAGGDAAAEERPEPPHYLADGVRDPDWAARLKRSLTRRS